MASHLGLRYTSGMLFFRTFGKCINHFPTNAYFEFSSSYATAFSGHSCTHSRKGNTLIGPHAFSNVYIYHFTSCFTLPIWEFDVIIDFRVNSRSLTTLFKKCNVMMT